MQSGNIDELHEVKSETSLDFDHVAAMRLRRLEGEGDGVDTPVGPQTPEQIRNYRARVDEDVFQATQKRRAAALASIREASSNSSSLVSGLIAEADVIASGTTGGTSSQPENENAALDKRHASNESVEDAVLLDEESSVGTDTIKTPIAPPRITLEIAKTFLGDGIPREYQIEGINWLLQLYASGVNGILADEMGLGKTMQSLALLGYLNDYRGIEGPHIVLAPKSTLPNWLSEIEHWIPGMRAVIFHGNKDERKEFVRDVLLAPKRDYNIIITSFEIAIREKTSLSKLAWKYLIVDEAHRIKNEQSCLAQVVRLFSSERRLLLTGTPLQNNMHELWALLNFLMPSLFSDSSRFENLFSINDTSDSKTAGNAENQAELVQQLHRVLRPFLLRRLKSEVDKSIPPKKELMLYVGLSEMQRSLYRALILKDIDAINSVSQTQSRMRLLNVLMQLRKCCNHPYLFEGQEPGPPFDDSLLVSCSGKLAVLDQLLQRLRAAGSRVLLFSQMTRLLDILEDYCVYRGYKYCRLDGSTGAIERQDSIDAYNAPNSELFLFLLSTRAGGLGINLATADTVVLYDSDWNPQIDLQAMDRAHRIGQTKQVTVYRLVTKGTVEEKIIERAARKLFLDRLVIQQGRLVESNAAVGKKELMQMIRFGADQIFQTREEASKVEEIDIDVLLKDAHDRTAELFDSFKGKAIAFNLDLDARYGAMSTDEMEESAAPTPDIPLSLLQLPSRERKAVSYSESAGTKQKKQKKSVLQECRTTKDPARYDFQFVPKRLFALIEKTENNWKALCSEIESISSGEETPTSPRNEEKLSESSESSAATPTTTLPRDDIVKERIVEWVKKNGIYMTPEGKVSLLTEVEYEEKERLLQFGFINWNRRDYRAFLVGCEKHGRNELQRIAEGVDTKTLDEVIVYSETFWKQGPKRLSDWSKTLAAIEKGEGRLVRKREIDVMLNEWLASAAAHYGKDRVLFTAKIPYYGVSQSRFFTEEEDRFLIVATACFGYGNWESVKYAVRQCPLFRLDWYLKSRQAFEIGRRVDTLVRLLEHQCDAWKKKHGKRTYEQKVSGSSDSESSDSSGKKRKRS